MLNHFLIFTIIFKDYKDALAGRASSKAGMKDSLNIFECISEKKIKMPKVITLLM
jgi:hypothetical protein